MSELEQAANLPPHIPWRTAMQMKSFLTAGVMLVIFALGVSQSVGQTNTAVPGNIGATSPLGSGLSDAAGNPQNTGMPYSGIANRAPCSTGNPGANTGTAALATFDGGGLDLSTSSVTPDWPALSA